MAAAFIFGLTYVALAFGRIPGLRSDRVAAVVVGAALMICFRALSAVIWIVFRRELSQPFPRTDRGKPPVVARSSTIKGAVVSIAVVTAFVLGAPPPLAAILGGSAMLLTRTTDPKRLYAHVDWTLLALFVGLFVVVGGLDESGMSQKLRNALAVLRADTVFGMTALAAVLSNVVSNVPAVMVLKSSVLALPHPERAWLTLAMASTLSGNLTLPGSLATIIVVERARARSHISFLDFLKVGMPSAVLGSAFGALWLGS